MSLEIPSECVIICRTKKIPNKIHNLGSIAAVTRLRFKFWGKKLKHNVSQNAAFYKIYKSC